MSDPGGRLRAAGRGARTWAAGGDEASRRNVALSWWRRCRGIDGASAALTSVGIVVLMLVSSFAMAPWIDLYAKDFTGLGVFMALFFWLGLSSTVVVACASLSPVLAGRRTFLAEDRDTSPRSYSNFP